MNSLLPASIVANLLKLTNLIIKSEMQDQIGVENGVIIGEGGHLFLASGAHSVLDYASGKKVVSEKSYDAFRENIENRSSLLKNKNIPYLHVIFPEKQNVLVDQFPLPASICLGDLYLKRNPDVADCVIYLKEQLYRREEFYLKTDTHPSDMGALVSAIKILETLFGGSYQSDFEKIGALVTRKADFSGDLGSKLTPKAASEETYLSRNWKAHKFSNAFAGNNGLVELWFSAQSTTRHKLLIFGDSFARSMLEVLSYFFPCIVFLRTSFLHPDIVDQIAPDVVLTQNAERYLSRVQKDEERPSFHMLPYLGTATDSYAPTFDFAEAFSAVLAGDRPPYWRFLDKLGLMDKKSP